LNYGKKKKKSKDKKKKKKKKDKGKKSSSSSKDGSGKTKKPKAKTPAKKWTEEEDNALRRLYPDVRDMASAFEILTTEDELQHRTAEQIARRLTKLGLRSKNAKDSTTGISISPQELSVVRRKAQAMLSLSRASLSTVMDTIEDSVDDSKELGISALEWILKQYRTCIEDCQALQREKDQQCEYWTVPEDELRFVMSPSPMPLLSLIFLRL
jgi:hypothetical protein